MKFDRLFENIMGVAQTNNISKLLLDLLNGINRSPSVASLAKEVQAIDDTFNVYGLERKDELLQRLNTLKQKIDDQYNTNDSLKFSQGTQAPNSQINRVIATLEYIR